MIENNKYMESPKKGSSEVPTLIRYISSNEVVGFDILEENKNDFDILEENKSFMNDQNQPISHDPLDFKTKKTEKSTSDYPNNETELNGHQRTHSVSISLPASPLEVHMQTNNNNKRVNFSGETIFYGGTDSSNKSQNTSTELSKSVKFHSQPMPKGSLYHQADDLPPVASTGRKMDRRFDSFKTFSGRLERQITNLRGGRTPRTAGPNDVVMQVEKNLPVDRYFDALQGPELDTLRASEEILLPEDEQWPFLLKFPISSFGICLGVSSQAIMWKALATSASTKFLHLSLRINFSLWCISVFLIALVFSIYLLKLVLYFEAVRREYYHPIRVNFFFAPWIALLFLALGVPPSVAENLPPALWYVLMTPIFCIEIKIYGQWMSGGQRRLSKVANPSNHLSIVGNFVGALLGASMGLKEGPLFFFAVGLAHYIVLFVTLYQRLPTNETLPKELHPVFFLFVAAPSVASMAWDKIQGSFDYGSRIAYFIALFLYFSLAVRINFFRGFKFSLAWWAYTFPMTGAAIATVKYSTVVTNVFTRSLAVVLSVVATLTVMALLVTTILHAFVFRKLFPNDIAIAISDRKPKHHKHWFHLRHGSSEDIDKYLKFADTETNTNDIEASLNPTSDDNRQV